MTWFSILFPALVIVILCAGFYRIERSIMATFQEVSDQLDAANTRLDGIQGDVTGLKAMIADLQSGATAAQMQALLDKATALATKAGVIDDQT